MNLCRSLLTMVMIQARTLHGKKDERERIYIITFNSVLLEDVLNAYFVTTPKSFGNR